MAAKRVHYDIYKKLIGVPWPGSFWDGAFTKAKALQLFKVGTYDEETFRIVKVTTEGVELDEREDPKAARAASARKEKPAARQKRRR